MWAMVVKLEVSAQHQQLFDDLKQLPGQLAAIEAQVPTVMAHSKHMQVMEEMSSEVGHRPPSALHQSLLSRLALFGASGSGKYDGMTHLILWSANSAYECTVTSDGAGTYSVVAHDGDQREGVAGDALFPLELADVLGQAVFSYFTDSKKRAAPGKIMQEQPGEWYVEFDDGDKAWRPRNQVFKKVSISEHLLNAPDRRDKMHFQAELDMLLEAEQAEDKRHGQELADEIAAVKGEWDPKVEDSMNESFAAADALFGRGEAMVVGLEAQLDQVASQNTAGVWAIEV